MKFFKKNASKSRKNASDCLIYIIYSLLYRYLWTSVDSSMKKRKIKMNSSAILRAVTFLKQK